MLFNWRILFSLGAFAPEVVRACKVLDVISGAMGNMKFAALTEKDISSTGRPSFYSKEQNLYLFHDASGGELGRWTISEDLFGESALAYIESWGVHPALLHAAHDSWELKWYTSDTKGEWVLDPLFLISCHSSELESFPDTTVFFDSGSGSSSSDESGFFVEVEKSAPELSSGSLYSLIRRTAEHGPVFMYRHDGATVNWMIGRDMGTDVGVAFVTDNAPTAAGITTSWNTLRNGQWVHGNGIVISGDVESNVYFNMRKHRSLQFIPNGQEFFVLKNFVPVPAVGFGTGGLRNPASSIESALRNDYRFLDLAREYHNEHIVGSLVEANLLDESFPSREEIFYLSKVWPTELGFSPTSNAIYQSLRDLKTNYLDSYLLHWPACYHHIEWMRCGETVDPDATWKDSWRALEKAYAEGVLMSIGVSNFGVDLLKEIWEFANVTPHILQNFADPSNLDLPARDFCYNHEVLYIPYAMQRNYRSMNSNIKAQIVAMAEAHEKTPNEIITRAFFQSNAAVIPRSDNKDHIVQNLRHMFDWKLSDEEMIRFGWPVSSSDVHDVGNLQTEL